MEGTHSPGDEPLDLVIKPLSPDSLDDFLHFFDHVGFTDNPDWSSCYCRYYHFAGGMEDWSATTAEDNREAVSGLIRGGIMHGYLAYANPGGGPGRPVGWCNVNLKSNFPLLKHLPDFAAPGEPPITSIVCYVISPALRRRGIAKALLGRVIIDAEASAVSGGPRFMEAYPRKGGETDAAHYHGHHAMYEAAGFTVYRELEDFFIMRREAAAP